MTGQSAPPDPAAFGGDAGPVENRIHARVTQAMLNESNSYSGYFDMGAVEKKRIDEAIRNSPALREVIGGIRFFHEGENDLFEAQCSQIDKSLMSVGQHAGLFAKTALTSDAQQLQEDLEELKEEGK